MFDVRYVTAANAAELAQWCGGLLVTEKNDEDPGKTQPGINVPTANGVERACLGDTIIEHKGSFSIHKH